MVQIIWWYRRGGDGLEESRAACTLIWPLTLFFILPVEKKQYCDKQKLSLHFIKKPEFSKNTLIQPSREFYMSLLTNAIITPLEQCIITFLQYGALIVFEILIQFVKAIRLFSFMRRVLSTTRLVRSAEDAFKKQ